MTTQHDSDCSTNNRGVPELLGPCDCSIKPHTMEDDFQHFLSYSSLSGEPADVIGKLRKAYEANWVAPRYGYKGPHDTMPIGGLPLYRSAPAQPIADMSAPTDERAAFEAWAVRNGFGVALREDGPDTYFKYETEQRWLVWQAARAAAPVSGPSDAVAKLYSRIKEMQEAAYTFGEYSKEAVSTALDGVLDEIDAISAALVSGRGMPALTIYEAQRNAAESAIGDELEQLGLVPKSTIKYTSGQWFNVRTLDEMEAFYMSRLPAIRAAAQELGYAIGLHGSVRRDFDLMAMQWRDDAADKDTLAHAIAVAACGITRDGAFQWEEKPNGRFAVSLPICWTDHGNPDFDKPSVGHIDLSIIDSRPRSEDSRAKVLEAVGQEVSLAIDNLDYQYGTVSGIKHLEEAQAKLDSALASTTPQKA